ncbi:hypothetical protein K523DRAFT_251811 [Schizophyllum commune Tattone D]|nr:hypothetical protein K525DRAFT_187536 [Schizophyllum commune Loenen D]KAI5825092.1 hypothetical protein K523DRAFT_251811 [Schizophyllum commune Tattone D]
MTAAYAFTDYRAQGQTLPAVVVDIAKVPNGQLNLFNVYVALSRSAELLQEDERLDMLDKATKQWWAAIAGQGGLQGKLPA